MQTKQVGYNWCMKYLILIIVAIIISYGAYSYYVGLNNNKESSEGKDNRKVVVKKQEYDQQGLPVTDIKGEKEFYEKNKGLSSGLPEPAPINQELAESLPVSQN